MNAFVIRFSCANQTEKSATFRVLIEIHIFSS
jgi:hypothetical protein